MTDVMTMKAEKAQLRRERLALRDAMGMQARIEAGLAMAEHGAKALAEPAPSIVSGFNPIRSEPDIRPLMANLRDLGARLCLPVIIDRQTIVFREVVRGAAFVETGFGTFGPGPDAAELDPDLMLVPLAAFDARGHRIGYGAGYYDRAIARLRAAGRSPRLIGIAFDLQEVERVPDEPHDVSLDAVLTESGLRLFGRPL
jgi:5-formyltetrahydrofolate cyclo-ligase